MSALELKLPPPVVTAIFAVIIWMISGLVVQGIELGALLTVLLTGLLLFAGLVCIICAAVVFKRASTTPSPLTPEAATSLVTSGIYQYTRNPMYVGLTLILLAWGAYLNSIEALLLVPLFILYITRFQILPEERALSKIFGEEFKAYQSQVRRWI